MPGLIVRDTTGKMIRTATSLSFIGPMDAVLAEAISVRVALSWLKSHSLENIIFETDSLHVYLSTLRNLLQTILVQSLMTANKCSNTGPIVM